VLGRLRLGSFALLVRPWGERGELVAGKEYFRVPNGVHCASAARRDWRVDSVIVDRGKLEYILPLIERGVSGPRFMGGWKLWLVAPGTMDGLTELIEGGGVEK
jgi:hypothetical protein